MRSRNIFNKVVTNEDSYTELWANLLQYKLVKEFFISNVLHKVECLKGFDFDYRDVTTQYSTDNGRPDLVIETNNTLVLIESKVYTYRALTENQPHGYLKILEESDDKRLNVLLFIVPKNYQYQIQLDNNNIKVLYWENIIHDLRESGLAEVNPIFKHFIDFSKQWFPLEKITFTEKEKKMITNGEVIKVLSKLRNIVTNIHEFSAGFDGIKVRLKANYEDYGVYFSDLEGNDVLYFGIWYDYWENENGAPLAIGIHESAKKSYHVFTNVFKPYNTVYENFEKEGSKIWWYMYNIKFDDQGDDITNKIKELLSKFFEDYFK